MKARPTFIKHGQHHYFCKGCGRFKLPCEFYKDGIAYKAQCKDCDKARSRKSNIPRLVMPLASPYHEAFYAATLTDLAL